MKAVLNRRLEFDLSLKPSEFLTMLDLAYEHDSRAYRSFQRHIRHDNLSNELKINGVSIKEFEALQTCCLTHGAEKCAGYDWKIYHYQKH